LSLTQKEAPDLIAVADRIRLVTLQTFEKLGFGHVGGAMSVIETLAVLYSGEMRFDPKNPKWEGRDYLVMSKGHAGPALYATLSLQGFFPSEMLSELNQGGGKLPSHCDMHKTPGIDMTTGSLGQGISTAIGMTLGARLNKSDNNVFLVMGDGELNEGQAWEGVMFAAHNKLDKLIAFVDNNKQQLDGLLTDIIDMGDIGEKFSSFGWHVQKVNGHDPYAIKKAIQEAKNTPNKPSVIVLDTIKGYGCDFAEGVVPNHHMNFSKEQIAKAIELVEQKLKDDLESAKEGA
jgi:transketolase